MRIRITLLSVFLNIIVLLMAFTTCSAQTISPSNPVVNLGQTQTFTGGGGAGTFSCTGCAGSMDSSTGVYTAPATVNAKQSLAGYQLLPNNHIYNTRIDTTGCPGCTASAVSGMGTVPFNIFPAFPINYTTNSTPTVTLVSHYTPGNDGTYQMPAYPGVLIEAGWHMATHQLGSADHHVLRIDSKTGQLQEQYNWYPLTGTPDNSCNNGTCNTGSSAKYNSTDYALPGCTLGGSCNGATDAAGMGIVPLILRKQELEQACANSGTINHALRITAGAGYVSNAAPLWPATQRSYSGGGTNPYGQRFRLKANYSISGFSACAQVILTTLKQYGVFLTDIGYNWQHNAEETTWSAADVAVFAEINSASIATSNWEQVDESSLMINSTSGEANVNRERVCYNMNGGGSACTDVILQGVTVNMLADEYNIMAGTPAIQIPAHASNTTLNWGISPSTGNISSSGVYTPPSTLANETDVTVTATSVVNSSVAATMRVRVWPNTGVYALPSYSSGNDYTDTAHGGHLWKSGAGIGINNLAKSLGCCSADNAAHFTGTDHQLWDHVFANLKDMHLFFIVPAGTYSVTYNFGTLAAPGAGNNNVSFVSQGTTIASNVDPSAGMGQYRNYTRSDSVTVTCNNQLNYDIQAQSDNGLGISSYSIVPTSLASCNSQGPAPPGGLTLVLH